MSSTPRPARASEGDLLAVFGVTAADLEANRSGRLGPAQVRLLWRMATANVLLSVLGAAAVVWFAHALLTAPIAWWQWVLVAVVALSLLANGGGSGVRLALAARAGAVQRHRGRFEPLGGRRGRVRIGGHTARLPGPALSLATDGQAYDAYVVAPDWIVVAVDRRRS